MFVVKYGGSFMDSRTRPCTGVARDVVFWRRSRSVRWWCTVAANESAARWNVGVGRASSTVCATRMPIGGGGRSGVVAGDQRRDRENVNSLGGVAKGFAGTDIFTCKRHAPEGQDYGFVGEVTAVNTAPGMHHPGHHTGDLLHRTRCGRTDLQLQRRCRRCPPPLRWPPSGWCL